MTELPDLLQTRWCAVPNDSYRVAREFEMPDDGTMAFMLLFPMGIGYVVAIFLLLTLWMKGGA